MILLMRLRFRGRASGDYCQIPSCYLLPALLLPTHAWKAHGSEEGSHYPQELELKAQNQGIQNPSFVSIKPGRRETEKFTLPITQAPNTCCQENSEPLALAKKYTRQTPAELLELQNRNQVLHKLHFGLQFKGTHPILYQKHALIRSSYARIRAKTLKSYFQAPKSRYVDEKIQCTTRIIYTHLDFYFHFSVLNVGNPSKGPQPFQPTF